MADELATTLLKESSTLTVGWVKATPSLTVPPGWVVNTSWAAVAAAITVAAVEVAVVMTASRRWL